MNQTKKRSYGKLIIFGILVIIFGALISEKLLIIIVAITIGTMLLFSYQYRMKFTIEDERVYLISEKASRKAFQFSTTIYAIIGAILILFGQLGYPEVNPVGYTLTSVAGFSTTAYLIFYYYFDKKF